MDSLDFCCKVEILFSEYKKERVVYVHDHVLPFKMNIQDLHKWIIDDKLEMA